MCDQGHKVTFDSQSSGKLIATAVRTSSNIYVLSEIGNKKVLSRKGKWKLSMAQKNGSHTF
jgi:hypothetical protein